MKKIKSDSPYPFGTALKAMRLGFHWHNRMKAFVRVSDGDSSDRSIVDIQTASSMVGWRAKNNSPMHRCWWEHPDDIFALTELRNVVGIKKPVLLTLADDGRIVGRKTGS